MVDKITTDAIGFGIKHVGELNRLMKCFWLGIKRPSKHLETSIPKKYSSSPRFLIGNSSIRLVIRVSIAKGDAYTWHVLKNTYKLINLNRWSWDAAEYIWIYQETHV